MDRPLLLVDAPSLYFRAFFGVPESMTAPDGTPVNAIRGFVDSLAMLIRNRRPDRVVCAMDHDWRPAWRVELVPSYKAHRLAADGAEQVPDALKPQVPVILDALAAIGIPAVGAAGYEADDILATLAARGPAPVEVVTGDRDLFQLVDDTGPVRVLYTARGVAKLQILDDAAIRARCGVPAAGYADFAVLRGDPSDGLPGVSGVGEKTAARLVSRYGSLEGVLNALHDATSGFAPGLRAKLVAASDYLAAAAPVVRVARDAPVPEIDGALPHTPVDPDAVVALAEKWNLAGSLRRLVDALATVE
ncbi:MAG TPA: 5'-3' exonuclease [Micromonosporaceae bacterium]|nr:5'-3' exonuclease [Micromonosporaceae bacterium]